MADWYYVYENKKQGPVALEDLRAMSREGVIDRGTHVWKRGMQDWRKAGSVDEIFQEPPPLPNGLHGSPSAKSEGFQSRTSDERSAPASTGFFTYKGRANRAQYFLGTIVPGIISVIGWSLIGGYDTTPAGWLLLLFGAFMGSFPTVRRFHDINTSGAAIILAFIPIVNLILPLVLTFKRGTKGPDRYGPDPLAQTSRQPRKPASRSRCLRTGFGMRT